jgi:signal transduction histidine kinase
MSTRLRTRDGGAGPADAAARVVHDLRAPLTVIRGLCETLDRDDLSPRVRRGLRMIDGEVTRLARGLDALTGRAAPEIRPVDLAQLAAAAVERFRWAAAEREVRVSVRAGRPAWTEGDAIAIARVLDNLLGNGLRHCPRGGRVHVLVAPRGRWVHVSVRDDGDGVPAADREVIFTTGERGSAPRGPGQGLGLAIAREIAEAHGGSLTLDRIGSGASFRLVLPRVTPGGAPCMAA